MVLRSGFRVRPVFFATDLKFTVLDDDHLGVLPFVLIDYGWYRPPISLSWVTATIGFVWASIPQG